MAEIIDIRSSGEMVIIGSSLTLPRGTAATIQQLGSFRFNPVKYTTEMFIPVHGISSWVSVERPTTVDILPTVANTPYQLLRLDKQWSNSLGIISTVSEDGSLSLGINNSMTNGPSLNIGNNQNIGKPSIVIGNDNNSNSSTAGGYIGGNNNITGDGSTSNPFVVGSYNNIRGQSLVFGNNNSCNAERVWVNGSSNIVQNSTGMVSGKSNTVSGSIGIVGGTYCSANINTLLNLGNSNSTSVFSIAIGNGNTSDNLSVVFGDQNSASDHGFVIGYSAVSSGTFSTVIGNYASDNGNIGANVHSSNNTNSIQTTNGIVHLHAKPTAQIETHIFAGWAADNQANARLRLTTDSKTVAANNIAALTDNSSAFFDIKLIACNTTTGDSVYWTLENGLLSRDIGPHSLTMTNYGFVLVQNNTNIDLSYMPSPVANVDLMFGGFDINWAPPLHNQDTWFVTATLTLLRIGV